MDSNRRELLIKTFPPAALLFSLGLPSRPPAPYPPGMPRGHPGGRPAVTVRAATALPTAPRAATAASAKAPGVREHPRPARAARQWPRPARPNPSTRMSLIFARRLGAVVFTGLCLTSIAGAEG